MTRKNIVGMRLIVLALCHAMALLILMPEPAFARRGSVHASNRRGGRHHGGHGGHHHGMHHGIHHGMHHGIHHGMHMGFHAHWHWGPHVFFHPSVFWHPFGFFLTALATTAIIVAIADAADDDEKVYYDNGTYYKEGEHEGQSGYVVVPAPIGARVPLLPEGNTEITVESTTYNYYAGAFYVQDTDKEHYVVVQGPVGAVVPYLPEGHTTKTVNDIEYYVYDSIYYQPKSSDGKVVYEVVQQPK